MNWQPPSAKTGSADEREKLKRIIARRGLCGLANDTKWDELISAIRAFTDWWPGYRYKCVDGPPMNWDVEWIAHLPFPLISVEWLDIGTQQKIEIHRLPRRTEFVDHGDRLEQLIRSIGLDFLRGKEVIRIFGYSPRNLELFND